MMNKKIDTISSKWLKAAVAGSIWAAIEIIAGSFLHNLRVPFAGTMLSMVSVTLLVLFIRHWNEGGIVLRAAVICALMKSISPSAVILGPMAAIFMEGLIIELVILIFRRNLFSYMLAGALAVSWALAQKVLSLLIIYGFDLVRIADALYDFLVRSTGIGSLSPAWLVITITAIYMAAGVFASLLGYTAYGKYRGRSGMNRSFTGSKRPDILHPSGEQKYSVLNILIITVCMGLILYLVNESSPWFYGVAGILFIVFVLIRYRQALHYLRKPRTWIQFILFTLIASLVWEGVSTGKYFSIEGVLIGLRMVFRALIIILGFSAISVELRNPLIRGLLFRNGLAPLYLALSLSFSALPAVISAFPELRSLWKQRKVLVGITLSVSDEMLNQFTGEIAERKNIFLISGSTHGGKTTLLKTIIDTLRDRNILISGILTHGTMDKGERTSFTAEILPSGDRRLLSTIIPKEGWLKHRKYYFDPAVFSGITDALREGLDQHTGPIVLDEVGPMELSGKGWYPLLDILKDQRDRIQIWVVREKLVREVMLHFRIPAENVFLAGEHTADEIVETIC